MLKYIILFSVIYVVYRYYNRIITPLKKADPRQPLQNQDNKQKAHQKEDEYIDYEEVD